LQKYKAVTKRGILTGCNYVILRDARRTNDPKPPRLVRVWSDL